MIFFGLIAQLKNRLAKRAEFHRLLNEINSFSQEDLVDMRANRTEMIYQAYQKVYGDGSD